MMLTPPLSKSDAQRALVLADILGVSFDEVVPPTETLPRDVQVLRDGLSALRSREAAIDCHDGGAPFRFLLTQAALASGHVTRFTGTPRLGERPRAPLIAALRDALGPLGLRIDEGAPWPVIVHAPHDSSKAARFEVTGEESSQFASSLLLGAARIAATAGHACEVVVKGALASEGYLELTRTWIERSGFRLDVRRTHADELRCEVAPGPRAGPSLPRVPGDWSSLTYLLLFAWKSGARVCRVDPRAAHPDRRFVDHLASIGLFLSFAPDDTCTVTGTPHGGLDVDASQCPDAVPTLAALASVLSAPSRLTHTAILRVKESDRLAGIEDLLAKAGATTSRAGDTLHITPASLRDFAFDARDDHRMAMAAATLAFLGGVKLRLHGRESVAKSFPGFWREVGQLGFTAEAA